MSCDQARGALSATLDGEARRDERAAAEGHLDSCARCNVWLASVYRVNRTLRLSAVDTAVDMNDRSGAILTEWDRARASMPRVLLLRLGLTAVAAVNAALAFVLILGSSLGRLGSPGEHAGRDLAAFPVTLGAAFLLSALDGRARGRLGVVTATVALLLISAVVDLAGNHTALAYELVHLPEVIGLVLLWRLARDEPTSARPRVSLRRQPEHRMGEAA